MARILPRSDEASRYAAGVQRIPALISSALLVTGFAACSQPHRPVGEAAGRASPMPLAWPYAPASIRVHPLSRLLPEGRVEVRVQCLDADGDAVKAIGMLRLQVGEGAAAVRVQADLNDRAVHELDWDPVLRDYRLLVRVPDGFACSGGESLSVKAELTLTPTRALQAEGRVACP